MNGQSCRLWLPLCIALCLPIGCDKGNLSQRLHAEAARARRELRPDDADAAFARALRFDPEDQVALEGLLTLRLERGQNDQAYQLVVSSPNHALRSASVRNLALQAKLRAGLLPYVLSDAAELSRFAALSPAAEREVLDALLRFARQSTENPAWLLEATTPEPWLAQTVLALVEAGELARAASVFVARQPSARHERPWQAARQALLLRLQHDGWPLEVPLLERLTSAPEQPLEYLGRLELLLKTERESEAARLEPSRAVLTPQWATAWDARWARLFAQRSDWRGVLAKTTESQENGFDEARRHALRCVAQLQLAHRAAAGAELEQWLSHPEAARYWSEILLLPELARYATALNELSAEREAKQARLARAKRPNATTLP